MLLGHYVDYARPTSVLLVHVLGLVFCLFRLISLALLARTRESSKSWKRPI